MASTKCLPTHSCLHVSHRLRDESSWTKSLSAIFTYCGLLTPSLVPFYVSTLLACSSWLVSSLSQNSSSALHRASFFTASPSCYTSLYNSILFLYILSSSFSQLHYKSPPFFSPWYPTGSFSGHRYFILNYRWSPVSFFVIRARRALHLHCANPLTAPFDDSLYALPLNP